MLIYIDKFFNYICLYIFDISGGGYWYIILFGLVFFWFVYFVDGYGFGS